MSDNARMLEEINRHCDPASVLVIGPAGLYRLYCPFRVRVLRDIDHMKEGQLVTVMAVKVTPQLEMVYVIQGKAYYFWYFAIVVERY